MKDEDLLGIYEERKKEGFYQKCEMAVWSFILHTIMRKGIT